MSGPIESSRLAANDQGPSVSSQSRNRAQSRQPASLCPPPIASRRSAEERAVITFAKDKQNRTIARFQSVFRVAVVSATTRTRSPDQYGLGRHVAENARQVHSPERLSESSLPVSRW